MQQIGRGVGMLLLAATCAGALDIVQEGKPAATIVVPVFTPEQAREKTWTTRAAEWVRDYVRKASGADLPIVAEDAAPAGNLIAVGATRLAADAGIDTAGLQWDGCRLAVKGRMLFLLGRDTFGPGPKSDYLGARGTCKAAAVFLEDVLGCRWFLPSPQGEKVPEQKTIRVPDDLAKVVNPVFAYSYVWSEGKNGSYGDRTIAALANNYRNAAIGQASNHTWRRSVPVEKYGEEHPEYFALIGGKRQAGAVRKGDDCKNYLCTSSPAVKDLIVQDIRRLFDEGWDWVTLGQSDGYQRCECPECEAKDSYRQAGIDDPDHPCERLQLLNKAVVDECRKSHPDKKISILTYGPTLWPSQKFDTYGDNVIVDICGKYEKTLPLWKPKVYGATIWMYTWGTYKPTGIGPKSTPGQVAEKLRLFRDQGVLGVFYCGFGEDWGLEGPVYYAVGRMMGNPDLNPDDCVKEYCEFVYGKAGPTMVQFFTGVYERVQALEGLGPYWASSFYRMDTLLPTLFTPAALQRLDGLLRQAEKQADTDRAKGWLKLTRDAFDYTRISAEMFMLYHAYQIQPTGPSLMAVKTAVEKWKAFRQKLVDYGKDADYVAAWFPGWDVTRRFIESGGAMASIVREPVNLDFDALAQKLAATRAAATAPARLVVGRATGPVNADGTLDEKDWSAATAQPLAGGNPQAKTLVRMLYDDKNLYLAFECAEPDIDKVKIDNQGRDGAVWESDCVEIFLDPGATREKFIHLIAAARPGFFYDARRGFITDPLHPQYGKEDVAWNPDWTYTAKLDPAGKRWTLEATLPFASLGVEPPKPDAAWTANFGRERYAGRPQPDLSLWSPNDAGTGFCDPLAFGELVFGK